MPTLPQMTSPIDGITLSLFEFFSAAGVAQGILSCLFDPQWMTPPHKWHPLRGFQGAGGVIYGVRRKLQDTGSDVALDKWNCVWGNWVTPMTVQKTSALRSE